MGRKGNGVELRAASIRVGFMLNGEWIRETLKLPPTPANEKYAARLVAQVNDAIRYSRFTFAEFFPDSPRAQQEGPGTFGDSADLYLKSISQKTPATIDQYTNAIAEWKAIIGPATPVKSITHAVLKAKVGGHPWSSAKRLNNALVPLRGVFAMLYPGPQAVNNPMNGIANEKVVRKLPDPLSASERDRILADMRQRYDARIGAYFQFAFYTGMRPEELTALQLRDLSNGNTTIAVRRVRVSGRDIPTVRRGDGPALALTAPRRRSRRAWSARRAPA